MPIKGTTAPIDVNWRSPFISIAEAVDFVLNTPRPPEPPKPLYKTFCAILDKQRYERCGDLLFVKVDENEIQIIAC